MEIYLILCSICQEKTKPIYLAPGFSGGLKKQSQFLPAVIDIKSYLIGGYGNNPPCGEQKNKPNSKHVPSASSGQALSEVERANFNIWY